MRIDLLRAQSEEKVLFSEWLTHYCVGHPHTILPLTVARRGGDDALMNRTAWTEQNRTEHTHIHRLSQHAGAHRQSCIQRWALVLSTIDKDVINVPTGFLSWPQHLLSFSFIWAPYWPASTGYKCIVERQVNPGMDSYVIMASSMIKTKLSRQVKTTLFNHNESVI